jgi:uncharacterized membrane protein YfhO
MTTSDDRQVMMTTAYDQQMMTTSDDRQIRTTLAHCPMIKIVDNRQIMTTLDDNQSSIL